MWRFRFPRSCRTGPSMIDKTASRPDRGSATLLRIAVLLSLRVGRPVGRTLLYPICLYFIAFAPSARQASIDYLTIVFGRRPRWTEVFRHFHVHAGVLLDRFFLLARGVKGFELQIEGLDVIEAQKRR